MNFLHDYLSVQFDPAHLLSEFGFELFQFVIIYQVWKKRIRPRMRHQAHDQFDIEHNIQPHHVSNQE